MSISPCEKETTLSTFYVTAACETVAFLHVRPTCSPLLPSIIPSSSGAVIRDVSSLLPETKRNALLEIMVIWRGTEARHHGSEKLHCGPARKRLLFDKVANLLEFRTTQRRRSIMIRTTGIHNGHSDEYQAAFSVTGADQITRITQFGRPEFLSCSTRRDKCHFGHRRRVVASLLFFLFRTVSFYVTVLLDNSRL